MNPFDYMEWGADWAWGVPLIALNVVIHVFCLALFTQKVEGALPQRATANVNCRIFPGVKVEDVRQQLQTLAGPDVMVTAVEGSQTPETAPTAIRQDILDAYKAAVATRFKDAPVVPYQSAGATDGAFLRANGIPVYGFGGLWSIVGEREGAHGLDERVNADGFQPIRTRLGVAYQDDCLELGATWRRDYLDQGDARRGNTFQFYFALRNLGFR